MQKLLIFISIGLSISAVGASVVSGKLALSKALSTKSQGIRTVFISILDPKAQAPMPCAAQKFVLEKDAAGEFLDFSLDSESLMMMACAEIPGTIKLKAKLDRDGNAGRDSSGDIVGFANNIKKGTKNVNVVLDKLVP